MGRGRAPCCDKDKVKRGPWSPAEDLSLISFIQKHGHGNWRALPNQAGLLRCGKSCRLRWINYLRPDVKRGKFSPQEEETIISLHTSIGNKWSRIASHLPGRTDNEIKNVWNTYLKKRALKKVEETSASPSSSHSTSCSIISSSGDQKNMENCSSLQECVKVNEPKEHSEGSHCASNSSRTNKVVGDYDLTHCQPLEIPLENGDMDDFWNILDSLETLNETSHIPRASENGDGEVGNDKLLGECFEQELQCKRWLRNLEYDLGLIAEMGGCDNKMSQPDQCTIFDAQYPIF